MDLTMAIAELRCSAVESGDRELVSRCDDALAGNHAARDRVVMELSASTAAVTLARAWPVCPRCLSLQVGGEIERLIQAASIRDADERRRALMRFGVTVDVGASSSTVFALALGWSLGALQQVSDEPYLFCARHAVIGLPSTTNGAAEGDHG